MKASTFLAVALDAGALKLSDRPEYKLSSGRMSPYCLDVNGFDTGHALNFLGIAFATALYESQIPHSVIFGPAYKGAAIAHAAAMHLSSSFGVRIRHASNRKEAKDHLEGGDLLGASLEHENVVMVDDVLTTGGTFIQSRAFIESHGGKLRGVVVGLERHESMTEDGILSARQYIAGQGIPVIAIATTIDLLEMLRERNGMTAKIKAIVEYQARYGVQI